MLEPDSAFEESVAPSIVRAADMAFRPSTTTATTGPDVINCTSSAKNGRSLCTL